MPLVLKRRPAKLLRNNVVVPFSISDNGVASVEASAILQSPGAKQQLEAVRRLRLAFNALPRK